MLSNLPLLNYKQAWSDFRSISNETLKIAEHLCQYTSILEKGSILDLGGGDGMLLKSILNSSKNIHKAHLVEWDKDLITKAQNNLHYSIPITDFSHADIRQIEVYGLGHKAILASHLFYLIEEEYLIKMFKKMPSNVSIYIILDEPYSVFDSFWIHTAPFYHERLKRIHKTILNLPSRYFNVKRSVIRSQMRNPSLLPEDKKVNIYSFLCYKNIVDLYKKNPNFFDGTISQFNINDIITYNSYCYEISKF